MTIQNKNRRIEIMKTVCPYCQCEYDVEEAYLSQEVQCSSCNRSFFVTKAKYCSGCGAINPGQVWKCSCCGSSFPSGYATESVPVEPPERQPEQPERRVSVLDETGGWTKAGIYITAVLFILNAVAVKFQHYDGPSLIKSSALGFFIVGWKMFFIMRNKPLCEPTGVDKFFNTVCFLLAGWGLIAQTGYILYCLVAESKEEPLGFFIGCMLSLGMNLFQAYFFCLFYKIYRWRFETEDLLPPQKGVSTTFLLIVGIAVVLFSILFIVQCFS